jgi:hypothetical protein
MPPDAFLDSRRLRRRTHDPFQQHVRRQGLHTILTDRRK